MTDLRVKSLDYVLLLTNDSLIIECINNGSTYLLQDLLNQIKLRVILFYKVYYFKLLIFI